MTPEQALTVMLRAGDELERRALRVILRAFTAPDTRLLVAQIVQAMQSASPRDRLRYKDQLLAIANALFPALPDDLLALTRAAAQAGAEGAVGMVPIAAPFVQPSVAQIVADTAPRLQALWGDARAEHAARVGRIITSALMRGGRSPVRADIQRALQVSRHHAQTIARTELAQALTGAQYLTVQAGAEDSGAGVVKVWRSAADGRTRASHAALNRQERPLDKPFSNGLMRPHDPRGKAADVVNCRCVLTYAVKE